MDLQIETNIYRLRVMAGEAESDGERHLVRLRAMADSGGEWGFGINDCRAIQWAILNQQVRQNAEAIRWALNQLELYPGCQRMMIGGRRQDGFVNAIQDSDRAITFSN